MTTTIRRLTAAGVALCVALVLAGCGADAEPGAAKGATSGTPAESSDAPLDEDSTTDAQQDASCEWDLPRLPAGDPVPPSGTGSDLATALVGSWQHTHYDDGDGFEALEDKDIRYVFPSSDQLIYCQHVPGVTEHADTSTSYTIEGSTIFPPAPHKGFEVIAWSTDSMLWLNGYDGSTFLLVRR